MERAEPANDGKGKGCEIMPITDGKDVKGIARLIKRKMTFGLAIITGIGFKISYRVAWATGLAILCCLSRLEWARRVVSASCKEEWASCCGGNQNNKTIIVLDNDRTTKELKKKLAQLLNPDFVNNVWCSKWSSVLAKNVIWLLLDRDEWSLLETISLDQRFLIETVGTALVAIVKGKENKM